MRVENAHGTLMSFGPEIDEWLSLDSDSIIIRLRGYAEGRERLWIQLDIASGEYGGTAAEVSYVDDAARPVRHPKGAVYKQAIINVKAEDTASAT